MSIGSVIEMPTPTAEPLMAPITGLVQSKMRSDEHAAAVARARVGELSVRPSGVVVERVAAGAQVGAGAERPPGAGHDHRPHGVVGVGLVERRRAAPRASSPVKALSCSGRFSVMIAAGPSTS